MALPRAPRRICLAVMALYTAWAHLDRELTLLSAHVRNFAAAKPSLDSASHFSLLDECLLEGLLSHVWQAWNGFCRECIIDSCVGTVDANGVTIPGLAPAASEAHVSSAAIRAKKQSAPPYWGQVNTVLRSEPTWGDVDVLTKIITRLRPVNGSKMLPAFSSAHANAKALQVIRNGAAHTNVQTLGEINAMRSSFLVFPMLHPTHAMFWIEPGSSDFLITHAIDELISAGLNAIS